MSGSLVGGVIGAVIGFTFGNPALGWMVGSTLGGFVDSQNKPSGPQLSDLRPQASEYGRPIPIVYGAMAVGGNVIWASDLVKTSEGDGGGKGGGGGGGSGPRYAANFAVLICESNGDHELGRIWAGPEKRLIWDGATFESGGFRFYDGSADQMPDPLIESYLGAGQVPAYRGYAYIVIEAFDVTEHDGNRIPFLNIEIGAKASAQRLGYVWPIAPQMWTSDGNIYLYNRVASGGVVIQGQNSPHTFVATYDFTLTEVVEEEEVEFDADRKRIVYFRGVQVVPKCIVMDLTTGTVTLHDVTVPAGMTTGLTGLSAFAGDMVYHRGYYLMVTRPTTTAHPVVYGVNPDTLTVDFLFVYSNVTSSGATFRVEKPADPNADYLLGVAIGDVWKMPLPALTGSASVSAVRLGSPAVSFSTTYRTHRMVDPHTGYLWTATRTVTRQPEYRVAAHDPVTETELFNVTQAMTTDFAAVGIVAVPGSPNKVIVYGDAELYRDYFITFDGDTPAEIGQAAGAARGLNELKLLAYDAQRNLLMGFRDGFEYAMVAETPAGVLDPSFLPMSTWHIGEQGAEVRFSPPTLADVVLDLSERAGLTVDQVDVTQLEDDLVDGYVLANQVTVRDAIAALMPAYYFDSVEDQGVLRFIKRGGGISVQIPDDDLGAHASSEDALDLYETTRGMDEELPRTLSVNYVLAATKYSPATKYARRLIGSSGDEARMDMPMVFTDQKALEMASVNLHEQWVSRVRYKVSLGRKYAFLMPTDIVGVTVDGQPRVMRLTKETRRDNGVLEFEAVQDDSDTYTPVVIVEETPPPDESVTTPAVVLLELM